MKKVNFVWTKFVFLLLSDVYEPQPQPLNRPKGRNIDSASFSFHIWNIYIVDVQFRNIWNEKTQTLDDIYTFQVIYKNRKTVVTNIYYSSPRLGVSCIKIYILPYYQYLFTYFVHLSST